jgi:RHS repeat-associated protein
MKRIAVALLVHIALFSAAVSVGGATRPKFRRAASAGAGDSRYLVTLSEEVVTDDPAALRQELALIYGAKLEVNASSDVRQFAVTMMSERARLLSADPRVIEVVEVPLTTPAPLTAASSHLKPRPSGYGDNGQSGTYTYDGAGNITAIGADTYVYDSAQRLVGSVTRGVHENYTYDAYGNRTSATGAVNCLGQTNCAQTVTVDSNTNHLGTINGAAVTYDDAGNIQTIAAASGSPGAIYSYDGTGMMTGATVGSDVRQFIYTADDERIAVKQGASWTWTIRDQSGKVLREFTSLESGSGPNLAMTNWQWAKDYVWRDGLLLATVSPSGTLHYHLDHLGTPRLITDANGVKVAEHAYYPFGAEINLTPHENPEEAMKFTGHERDLVVGDGRTLDYMHARYYSPTVGRFLSVDPIIPTAAVHAPQRWNRYAYVSNNPMRNADPTGKLLEVRAGTCDDKTPCYSKVDTYQAVQNFVGKDAAKYLQLGKNGQVTLNGISAANFIKLGGGAAIIGNLIRSTDRTAAFALSADAKGGAFTEQMAGGTLTKINPAAFPTIRGGATQTLDTAMAHDLGGHGLQDMWGISPRDPRYGSMDQRFTFGVNWGEAFAVTLENQYRASQGMDIRGYYLNKYDYDPPAGAPKP